LVEVDIEADAFAFTSISGGAMEFSVLWILPQNFPTCIGFSVLAPGKDCGGIGALA
jgi:hypothetical protein